MKSLLENVEFVVGENEGVLSVMPPILAYLDIEIPEDIVEEVGRLYGYDRLPLILPTRDLAPASRNTELDLKSRARTILSKAGANEVLTYTFEHGNLLKRVGRGAELRRFSLVTR